jgi:hypothetical protein
VALGSDGWFDWAIRDPGPEEKLWEDHEDEGVVFHSAVGSAQSTIDVVHGPASNNRSVTGLIHYDGTLTQFYAVGRSPWANGNKQANLRFKGFEFEGGGYWPNGQPNFSEPWTEKQKATGARILKEMLLDRGRQLILKQTCHEHNEFFATACPSGRVPWVEIIDMASQVVVARRWLYGDQTGGAEKVGKQTFLWNEGVMGNAIGNYDGTLPGTFYHLRGDRWIDPLNEDPEVDNS